mgnify:FL=1|jgi:hypothetical protein
MIEIAHMLFVYTPIELRVIILACLIGGIYLHFKERKNNDNR